MNTNLLKKCITELEKDDPNIDYLRGMLETLYEMQEDKKVCPVPRPDPLVPGRPTPPSPSIKNTEVKSTEMDEGKILEENMLANLGKVDKSAIVTEQP